jgi:flagellar biosynthesis/type III secretory pathway M-ring protein FliF/YscJ
MDFLRKMIAGTWAHLAGLGASQKVAIFLCVVVMAGALVWMFQWSGQPEWEPILPGQAWTDEELDKAKKVLEDREYKVAGNQILVRASDRRALRGRLGQAGALPRDTRQGFEALMKEASPWKSQVQQNREWVVAYGNQLAMDLEGWKGVRRAQVILQMPKQRQIGSEATRPSASVSIELEDAMSMDRAFVHAIAMMVSGATGVPPENVHIVDRKTHKPFRVPDPGGPLADDLHELRVQKERYFEEKISRHLDIPGIRVIAYADIETDRRRTTERTPTEGKSIEKKETKEETTEKRSPTATDPGVQPNTGMALSSPGQNENSEQASKSTEYLSALGEKTTTTDFGIGAIKKLTASINVPRSYLAAIFSQQADGRDKAVTDKDIDAVAQKEFVKIRKQVINAIGAVDEKLVEVDWYYDHVPQVAAAVEKAEGDTVVGLIKAYGKQVGLGLLAVMSLLMMLMMVRRGPSAPLRSGSASGGHSGLGREMEELGALSTGLATVGEAVESVTALEAEEMDEKTVQTQHRIEQVSSLVTEDPDTAANLIRRWLANEQR